MSIKFMLQRGFTLVEVAVVLVIVGLLLAGGINLMSASGETAKYKQTQNETQNVKEALTTYFIQNGGVLPCPDIHNDVTNASYGQSDYASGDATAGGVCTNYEGWLPHVTLGIGGSGDAWGERYKYVVSRAFTAPPGSPVNLCTGSFSRNTANAWRISVYDLLNSASVAPVQPATGSMLGDWAAFALISTGKNGRQANSAITSGSTGAFAGCSSLDAREQYHCIATTPSTTQPFYLRFGNQMTDGTTVTFDDMVVWVGDMQLISELRNSGSCTSGGGSGGSGGGGSGSAANPTSRTATDFTANPGQTVSGNFNANDSIPVSNGDDKAVITGNMNKALNLQDGNNTLDVQGNANGAITAGTGNDTVRVKGNLSQPITLGAGNDYAEVWGNANATINMGDGDDAVRIEGNMTENVSLGAGSNAIYVGGNVNADITATGGTATVYLNAYSSLSSVPSAIKGDASLTLKCNVSSAWVTCS